MSVMEKPAALAARRRCDGPLLAEIRARRDEFGQQRFVPREFIAQLKKVGVYRAATPQCFGGSGLSPMGFLQMIERISEADARSAGSPVSARPRSTWRPCPRQPRPALCQGPGPDLRRRSVPAAAGRAGRGRLDGQWHLEIRQRLQGRRYAGRGYRRGRAGQAGSKPRTAVLPPQQVEIVENWDVMGLVGTGSHDLKVVPAIRGR
jgi:hypothetical protein